jgi:acetyl esterase
MIRTFFERSLVATVSRLPTGALKTLAGSPPPVIEGQALDPQIHLMIALADRLGKPKSHELSVEEARRSMREQTGLVDAPALGSVHVENRVIPAGVRPQSPPLPVRIFRPRGLRGPAPLVVYYHGGGFVVGDTLTHDPPCRVLAERARCVVASVDYRLGPENLFPAGVEDGLTALRWAQREATSLGVDPRRIAIGGDSAGGNIAAVVAHTALEGGGQGPALQLLVYPVTDMTASFASRRTFAAGFILERETMDWFTDRYLTPDLDRAQPRLSPLFAPSFAGVCPALVLTAGFDPLRDEGRAYADKLREEGIPVWYRNYPGLTHGFWNMSGAVAEARRALHEACDEVRAQLAA